jgi:hypothetical protein
VKNFTLDCGFTTAMTTAIVATNELPFHSSQPYDGPRTRITQFPSPQTMCHSLFDGSESTSRRRRLDANFCSSPMLSLRRRRDIIIILFFLVASNFCKLISLLPARGTAFLHILVLEGFKIWGVPFGWCHHMSYRTRHRGTNSKPTLMTSHTH